MKEKNEKEIKIEEVDGETLELLINYCYLGTININEDNVERILSTACRFQMSNVVSACSNFLGKQLHFSNAIGFNVFAEQQNCSDLHQISLKFVESNFMEIYEKSEEFLQLNVEQLSNLLQNDDIFVISEQDVFKAVVKWINFSDDRKQYISTLLPLVKIPQLSPTFIADEVEKYCSTLDTQKMLLDAYKYLLIPERRDLSLSHAIPRKSTVGKLLCLGGMDHNKGTTNIESYDLRENKWELLKSMPTRRLQFGCALYMDKLIIVGKYVKFVSNFLDSKNLFKKFIGGRDGLKTLNSVDAVDLQTMNFTSLMQIS
jgi:kelch-like protein 1/4/5